MNAFDDFQIEDSANFELIEASYDSLFDEEEDDDDKTFNAFLNSNFDF